MPSWRAPPCPDTFGPGHPIPTTHTHIFVLAVAWSTRADRSGGRAVSLSQKTPDVTRLHLHLKCGLGVLSSLPSPPEFHGPVLRSPRCSQRKETENHPHAFPCSLAHLPKLFHPPCQIVSVPKPASHLLLKLRTALCSPLVTNVPKWHCSFHILASHCC